MSNTTRVFPVVAAACALLLWAAPASASEAQADKIRALDRMMESLASESARDGAAIRYAYRAYLDLLMLDGYADIVGALANGGLAPLPSEPLRFNLTPRLEGPHPIGEKDLANQANYVAARPSTVGMLLTIASRVKSGPIEITSLVRHNEYQSALQQTNANAATSVPTHTLGLAIDIALINTPLETAHELRDVLRQMRRDGDLLFIGERRQLVFHVVPHPSRLGYFMDVYTAAMGAPSATRAAEVMAPAPPVLGPVAGPRVVTEMVSFIPAVEPASDGWLQEQLQEPLPGADLAVTRPLPEQAGAPAMLGGLATRLLLPIFGAFVATGWRLRERRRYPR